MQVKSESEVPQSCPTLSDSMVYSLPGSSIHGVFQARVLEWVAITFSISSLLESRRLRDFDFHGFPGGASGKELACQCRRHRRRRFDPWVRKIPRRRKWQQVSLPGESHGQRSLAGYSPRGRKELDMTEVPKRVLSCVWLFVIPWTVDHHGILQARILERAAISFSRGSFWPMDWKCISCIDKQILYHWTTWEAPYICIFGYYLF